MVISVTTVIAYTYRHVFKHNETMPVFEDFLFYQSLFNSASAVFTFVAVHFFVSSCDKFSYSSLVASPHSSSLRMISSGAVCGFQMLSAKAATAHIFLLTLAFQKVLGAATERLCFQLHSFLQFPECLHSTGVSGIEFERFLVVLNGELFFARGPHKPHRDCPRHSPIPDTARCSA